MTRILAPIVLVTASLALGGCLMQAYQQYPDFGNATAKNAQVQIVDPAPAGAANTKIDMNGDRANFAFDSYKTNKVAKPVVVTTGDVVSDTGAGGTGGGVVD